MAKIEYVVSSHETANERLGTVQEKTLKIVERFDKPTVARVGTYTSSMDQRSGKGTFVASYETFSIDILFTDDEIGEIDEMLYSLMDYQQATLFGSDIPKLAGDRTFVLTANSWSFPSAGCTSNRLSFSGKFLP